MIRWFLDIARRKYGNGSRGVCTVRVVTLSLIAGALLAVAAVPADAGHRDKRCGIVASGAGDFRVSARKVRCDFAKRWTRAYLGRRSAPQGWQCYRPGRDIASYCTRGSRAFWSKRL
jgi:hypothetical protein